MTRGIFICGPLIAAAFLAASLPSARAQTSWFLIETAEGDVIGETQTITERTEDGVIERSISYHMTGAPGERRLQQTRQSETLFSPSGDFIRFAQTGIDDGREVSLRVERTNSGLMLERSAPRIATSTLAEPPASFAAPDLTSSIHSWDFDASPFASFDGFNPETGTLQIISVRQTSRTDFAPDIRTSFAVTRSIEGNPASLSWLHFDEDNRLTGMTQPNLGGDLFFRRMDSEPVISPSANLNAVETARIRSPYRISRTALRGHIRYEFELPEDFDISLPQTGEQRVRVSGRNVTVDICDTCGRLEMDEEALAAALRPTLWLESSHPDLLDYAVSARNGSQTDRQVMEWLVNRLTRRFGRVNFSGHYSALERFRSREGDCVEDALVLAALGRAAGIPSLVASGLVYTREAYHGTSNSFMPHAWVVAYVDGEWVSFDRALGDFDAGHIALGLGDGEPFQFNASNQIASLLNWTAMNEVRRRPSE